MFKFFKLRQITVTCPLCETVFATHEVVRLPAMSRETPVEADLHRILPDAELRSNLLAMCPNCVYTYWLTSFTQHYFLPQVVPDSPPVSPAKKFAHAVQSARQVNNHALDRSVLALNGYWCSREEGVEGGGEKFLRLAKVELTAALSDNDWVGNRSRYNYVMGEILRLLGEFPQAIEFYQMVDRRSGLPFELVDRMQRFAVDGNKNPVRLPPHIVEAIFVPPMILSA
ncbi:MAG: hypothetical protein KGS72_02885 [Cyanobacteria bacterium REEB67]|nr:hypothetical protein [Cyanobacteria bacterium REEB67]